VSDERAPEASPEGEDALAPAFVREPVRWMDEQVLILRRFFEHVGRVSILGARTVKTLFTSRFDLDGFVYQLEQLGVRSLMIAAATAVFVGIVMTIQFAFFAEKYGAKDSLPRIIGLSEARELAPALTSLVVGCRIAAGMAAELGSMAVTEQIDAIRALGADPLRKLVVPRVLAAMCVMPLMCTIAFFLGMLSAMAVTAVSFGLAPDYFYAVARDAVTLTDLASGFAKTPFFGVIVGLIACYFGMNTRGGTEGVGRSTTSSVVAAAVALLISDALLTQILMSLTRTS
jgi:phospholipid/cholesterol/gamma-HCH transport system permease protein